MAEGGKTSASSLRKNDFENEPESLPPYATYRENEDTEQQGDGHQRVQELVNAGLTPNEAELVAEYEEGATWA